MHDESNFSLNFPQNLSIKDGKSHLTFSLTYYVAYCYTFPEVCVPALKSIEGENHINLTSYFQRSLPLFASSNFNYKQHKQLPEDTGSMCCCNNNKKLAPATTESLRDYKNKIL